jgi:ATP-dependent DNA ligase
MARSAVRESLQFVRSITATFRRRFLKDIEALFHLEADGEVVFRHACNMGLEGIVSKRRDSRYSSGATPNWVKSKNPNSATVEREATEDWGKP